MSFNLIRVGLVMIFFPIHLLGNQISNYPDCFLKGRESEKVWDVMKHFKNYNDTIPYVESRNQHYSNTIDLVVSSKCTVKDFNSILRKFNACIFQAVDQQAQFTIRVPDPKALEILNSIIKKMTTNKCLLKVNPWPPSPAPA